MYKDNGKENANYDNGLYRDYGVYIGDISGLWKIEWKPLFNALGLVDLFWGACVCGYPDFINTQIFWSSGLNHQQVNPKPFPFPTSLCIGFSFQVFSVA